MQLPVDPQTVSRRVILQARYVERSRLHLGTDDIGGVLAIENGCLFDEGSSTECSCEQSCPGVVQHVTGHLRRELREFAIEKRCAACDDVAWK